MSARAAAWLAWSLCAFVLALIACAVVLGILNDYGVWDLTFLSAEVSAALVGGLIASRRPRNPIGWFILGHALCFSMGGLVASTPSTGCSPNPVLCPQQG